MDGTIHATAAEHPFIRSINNRISFDARDIATNDGERGRHMLALRAEVSDS